MLQRCKSIICDLSRCSSVYGEEMRLWKRDFVSNPEATDVVCKDKQTISISLQNKRKLRTSLENERASRICLQSERRKTENKIYFVQQCSYKYFLYMLLLIIKAMP